MNGPSDVRDVQNLSLNLLTYKSIILFTQVRLETERKPYNQIRNDKNISIPGEKPHACPECKKRFSSTSNLKTHMRLHKGEKPFACEKCPLSFTQFVHLKLHKRLHNNERPFICGTCGKSYISASGLRTHWKTTKCEPSPAEEAITAERSLFLLQQNDQSFLNFNHQQCVGGGGCPALVKMTPASTAFLPLTTKLWVVMMQPSPGYRERMPRGNIHS